MGGLGMRFRALVAVVGVLLAAMTVNALAASQVKSVRLWRAPDKTRVKGIIVRNMEECSYIKLK
jgi:N-acetylmuramoyl-L-alanine amidase